MISPHIIDIFKTLSAAELKQLADFVRSPIYNKNQKVVELFEFIRASYPKFEESKLTKKAAILQLKISGKVYLRKIIQLLHNVLKQFLIYLESQKYSSHQEHLLFQALSERKLYEQFEKSYHEHKQVTSQAVDTDYFYYKYLIANDLYEFTVTKNNRTPTTNFDEVIEAFDIYLVVNKLRLFCIALNRENIFGKKFNKHLMDEISLFIQKNNFQQYPTIDVYNTLRLMMTEADGTPFYKKLKKLLAAKSTLLPLSEQQFIYTLALNFCSTELRKGQNQYLEEVFSLYKLMLDKDLLTDEGYISPHYFKNLNTLSLKLNKFAWAKGFVNEYKAKLPPKYRENMVNYCLGVNDFYQKKYKDAIFKLSQTENIDFFYHINTLMLLIKAAYEIGDMDFLKAKLEALRIYIRRNNTIAEQERMTYRNFINSTKRLLTLRNSFTFAQKLDAKKEKQIERVTQKIKETDPLIDKTWLLEKLAGLK